MTSNLLMFSVVTSNGSVGSLRLDGLSVRTDEHGSHQTQGAVSLCDHVGLHVSVVVLARPDEAAVALQHLCYLVVDEALNLAVW